MLSRSIRPFAFAAFAVVIVSAFVAPAIGARFTDRYDPLEATLTQRSAALDGLTDKDSKSQKKLFDGALKKLTKTTTSLKTEIKLGKQVSAPLRKKLGAEDQILADLSGAADGLKGDVQVRIDAVQVVVDNAAPKITSAKVQKLIDAAKSSLTQSDAETDLVKRYVRIGQAESKTTQAEKLAPKIDNGGGGGGGGGNCPGTALNPGEVASATVGVTAVQFDRFQFRQTPNDELPIGATSQVEFIVNDCPPETPRTIKFFLPDPSQGKVYTVGFNAGNAFVTSHVVLNSGGFASSSGTVTLTTFDSATGAISMTFDFENFASTGDDVTNGTLTLNNFRR